MQWDRAYRLIEGLAGQTLGWTPEAIAACAQHITAIDAGDLTIDAAIARLGRTWDEPTRPTCTAIDEAVAYELQRSGGWAGPAPRALPSEQRPMDGPQHRAIALRLLDSAWIDAVLGGAQHDHSARGTTALADGTVEPSATALCPRCGIKARGVLQRVAAIEAAQEMIAVA